MAKSKEGTAGARPTALKIRRYLEVIERKAAEGAANPDAALAAIATDARVGMALIDRRGAEW